MPLLGTKTFVPRRGSRAVPRPRFRERLGEATERRLTLVSPPAGFGKTSLVNKWLATCGKPVAWLSLDESDADPARFLAYLIAALRTVMPVAGDDVLPLPGIPAATPDRALVAALVNDLARAPGDGSHERGFVARLIGAFRTLEVAPAVGR